MTNHAHSYGVHDLDRETNRTPTTSFMFTSLTGPTNNSTYPGQMGTGPYVLNTIAIAAHTMLLTQTGGIAVHLTQPADIRDDARPAIPSHWRPSSLRPDTEETAELAELREPRWAPRTLCGIRWTRMAGSDSIGDNTDDGHRTDMSTLPVDPGPLVPSARRRRPDRAARRDDRSSGP